MQLSSANRRHRFRVKFWGVRGSYPTSGEKTLKFGGRTSCVEVEAGPHRLIFDAGTGIIPLGKELLKDRRSPRSLYIFLSHAHHDHIFGLHFFEPMVESTRRLFVFGPDAAGKSLRATLERAMGGPFFPVSLQEFDAPKRILSLKGGEIIRLRPGRQASMIGKKQAVETKTDDEITILTHKSPAHPKHGVMLYRINYRDRSLVYATDIEQKNGGYPDVIQFAQGTDLLIHDAQYLSREYLSRSDPRQGWGHSTVETAAEVAKKAHVKRLALFHHEPTHDDKAMREIERKARRWFPATVAAYDGMKLDLL